MTRPLLSFCLLALAAAHAVADPAGEQLFRDGRALLKAGKVDEACDKFQQSRDVETKFGTVLNLADCRERQGKLATAWELFLEAKGLATTQKGAADIAEATRRAKLVERARAFLTVTVPAADRVPGLVILRDGRDVAPSTWDQPLPIDPGSYAIEATATGYEPTTIAVQVAARANVNVTVPALVKLAVVDPPPEPPSLPGPTAGKPGGARPPQVDGVHKDGVPPEIASISPPLRRASAGLAFGFTHKGDVAIGIRLNIQTAAGPGAVRGQVSAYYTKDTPEDLDPAADVTRKIVWFGAEYLLAWKSGLASAAGVGYGIEHISGGYSLQEGTESVTRGYPLLRLSPIIVRLSSAPIELGVHAVLDLQKDLQSGAYTPILFTTLALDWFFW